MNMKSPPHFITAKDITETELKNLLTAQIVFPRINVRVIIVHAPQETDNHETRLEFFEELSVQIERCLTSGDEMLIMGDFNGRIGLNSNNEVVHDSNSSNGKLLNEIIEKYKLEVGNFNILCSGKWTRIQPCKDGTTKKSVLDYLLIPKIKNNTLKSIFIDEEKIYCPFRVKTLRGKQQVTFSDHCVMVADIELDIGHVKKESGKVSKWWFSKEGFDLYVIESDLPIQVDMAEENTSKTYESWVVEFEKLLAKCFRRRTYTEGKVGKVANNNKHAEIRKILSSVSKRGRIQRNIVKQYQKKLIEAECHHINNARAERLKKTTENLTIKERFSPVGYWKVKKAADKGLRKDPTATSIITEEKVEIEGENAVKGAYLEEFERRLQNRVPEQGWKQFTEETNSVIRNWLQQACSSSPPFSSQELDTALSTLKDDSSPGLDNYPPKLFSKGGSGLKQSLLKMFNIIKKTREIPEQWDLVRIVTIYKRKGSRKELKYYRGIFLTIVVSKIFEKLIKVRIEGKLDNINLLQAGSRRKRGPPDNVFLFRAVMDHYKFTKKTLFITAYDFEQAFDSLWLEDCVLSLKELGVEKEYLQLIYNLNKQAKFVVQTPFGLTSVFKTDPIVKQGTVLGPCLCSSSTGEYCGKNVGVSVGSTIISSLLYVDDIIDISSSVEDYILAHQNALVFKRSKKLTHSGTKCFSMILNRNCKEEVPLLKLDEISHVILTKVITYLGDVFNCQGNNDGLIADRLKRGTKAMITIASLMAETEVGVHHVSVMLLLYRALFLSTILFNSGTWSNLRKQDLDSLRTLQLKYLQRVVGVASSTANAFVFLELGVLPIDYEIEKRQLMYLHKILNLDPTDPVNKIFMESKRMAVAGEKNWWSGVKPLLEKYNLPSDLEEIKEMSKECFARNVKASVTGVALHQLVTELHKLKKTKTLCYESLKLQDYLRHLFPTQARTVFKWRSGALDLKTHLTYKYNDTRCRNCDNDEETPEHVINCGAVNVIDVEIDVLKLDELDDTIKSQLKLLVLRLNSFLEKVNDNE